MGFEDLVEGSLNEYLILSQKIGDVVNEQASFVKNAFAAQQEFLNMVNFRPKPDDVTIQELLKPTSDAMQAIHAHREKNRTSKYFNHLSVISESITVLGWVVVTPDPSKYAKELHSAAAYYGNKVITAFKDKDEPDVPWTKAWLSVLTELHTLIREQYRCGLTWNSMANSKNAVNCPPPPPPPPPPPIDALDALQISNQNDDPRSALLRELNKGADITKSLKKVEKGKVSSKEPVLMAPCNAAVKAPVQVSQKPPKLELDGRKWCVEYQEKNNNIVISDTAMNQSVYVFKCNNCQISVKGKVNCITLDSSKNIWMSFEDIVSSLEIINCEKIKVQPLKKLPTAIIDKSDGVMLYLSDLCMDVEIVSSKSSEMNIALPDPTDDWAEHAVPEQLKTTIVNGKLHTVAVDKM